MSGPVSPESEDRGQARIELADYLHGRGYDPAVTAYMVDDVLADPELVLRALGFVWVDDDDGYGVLKQPLTRPEPFKDPQGEKSS